MKTNIPVNFQASLHEVCTFQYLRVYGMLGHNEGSIPQSVWSPVICCWPKPGCTSIWGREVQCDLGDLCLHAWWPLQLWPLPLWWHWVLRDSHLSPSLLGGILTSLLDGCFCLQPLMCQVFKALSIPSIHASLLNGQKLLKNKSTLSPHYWCASGWEHSTFTLEHTDGELQDVGYWGDGWDRYGSVRNKERLA